MNHLLFTVLFAFLLVSITSFEWEFPNPNLCGSTCKSKVAINCKVTGVAGNFLSVDKDCTNQALNGKELKFFKEEGKYGEKCGTKVVNVTITYKICNENDSGDLVLNPDRSWMSYDGLNITFKKNNISPDTCFKKKVKRSWDLCTVSSNKGRRQRAWDVQIDASHPATASHCYCYTFRRSTHSYTTEEKSDTKEETSAPSSPQITKVPTGPGGPMGPGGPTGPGKGKGKGKGKNAGSPDTRARKRRKIRK